MRTPRQIADHLACVALDANREALLHERNRKIADAILDAMDENGVVFIRAPYGQSSRTLLENQ
jgi:hypothetical protein